MSTPLGVDVRTVPHPSCPDGLRLVIVNVETLKAAIREVLAEMRSASTAPEVYSQTCLPPGMTRRSFLDAIRRGELPARAAGKARFVTRVDYEAFVASTPPVCVGLPRRPSPANDVRSILRAAQGK